MNKHFQIRKGFEKTGNLSHYRTILKHNREKGILLDKALKKVLVYYQDPTERMLLEFPWLRRVQSEMKSQRWPRDWKREEILIELILTLQKKNRLQILEKYWGPRLLVNLTGDKSYWVKNPLNWMPRKKSAEKAAAELTAHLLSRYPVPPVMEDLYVQGDENSRNWYIQVGQGTNIRKLGELPRKVTKKMAHLVGHAPQKFSLKEALNWAFVRAEGGSKKLASFFAELNLDEGYLSQEIRIDLLRFIIREKITRIPEINRLLDYLVFQYCGRLNNPQKGYHEYICSPPNEGITLKGATRASIFRKMEDWETNFKQVILENKIDSWEGLGISPFNWTWENGDEYRIEEIRTKSELTLEGLRMNHCVGGYDSDCFSGESAIFSLKVKKVGQKRWKRLATLELIQKQVLVEKEKVTPEEFKMKNNREPDQEATALFEEWRAKWLKPFIEQKML